MNNAPSLFDDGQIGTGSISQPMTAKATSTTNLVDLLHDGFYIVFLLKNKYIPSSSTEFREKIIALLNRFENQARKLQFSSDDIQDAKYAYCALLDETIVTQQDAQFFELQNSWLISPLQLSLFGSQLAGYRFFETLEELRRKGNSRLAALEVYHYCMLLGFHEIDYLKGKKAAFSPFASLPDQIKHMIHRELPFYWILLFLIVFALLSFAGLRYMLSKQSTNSLATYENVISTPTEQAHITIHLP